VSGSNSISIGATPEYELAVKLALGPVTLIYVVCFDRFDPPAFVAFSLIVKFPGPNSIIGFCEVLNHTVMLSPVTFRYDQFQLVGLFVEVSENTTQFGAEEFSLYTVKDAFVRTGVGYRTITTPEPP
jgi:hypothetical protein